MRRIWRSPKCACCGHAGEHRSEAVNALAALAPALAAIERDVNMELTARTRIAEYGWTLIGVDDGRRSFVYTAGLTRVGLPELCLADFAQEQMEDMSDHLNTAAEALYEGRWAARLIGPGDTLLVGESLVWHLCVTGLQPTMAYRLYGRREVRMLELVA